MAAERFEFDTSFIHLAVLHSSGNIWVRPDLPRERWEHYVRERASIPEPGLSTILCLPTACFNDNDRYFIPVRDKVLPPEIRDGFPVAPVFESVLQPIMFAPTPSQVEVQTTPLGIWPALRDAPELAAQIPTGVRPAASIDTQASLSTASKLTTLLDTPKRKLGPARTSNAPQTITPTLIVTSASIAPSAPTVPLSTKAPNTTPPVLAPMAPPSRDPAQSQSSKTKLAPALSTSTFTAPNLAEQNKRCHDATSIKKAWCRKQGCAVGDPDDETRAVMRLPGERDSKYDFRKCKLFARVRNIERRLGATSLKGKQPATIQGGTMPKTQANASIGYLIGDENVSVSACTHCWDSTNRARKPTGEFVKCVSVSWWSDGKCMNCEWDKQDCSIAVANRATASAAVTSVAMASGTASGPSLSVVPGIPTTPSSSAQAKTTKASKAYPPRRTTRKGKEKERASDFT